jgi:hypothetical protein
MEKLLQKLKLYTKKNITKSQLEKILNEDKLILLAVLSELGRGKIVFCPHNCDVRIFFPNKKVFLEFLKQEKIRGTVEDIYLTESEFEKLRRFISAEMWSNAYYDKKTKTLRMTIGY